MGLTGAGVARAASPAPDGCAASGPVNARNTSSRVGRRAPSSTTSTSCSRSRDSTAGRLSTSSAGRVSRRCTGSTCGAPCPRAPSTAAARSSPFSPTVTSSTVAPTRSLSWSGVPSATTLPASSSAMRSASWSASSRYCEVSRTVVPLAARSRITSHSARRVRGSSPVVGSSSTTTGVPPMSPAAMSRRRRVPPDSVPARRSAASVSASCSSSSLTRSRRVAGGRWYSRAIRSRFSAAVRRSSTAAYWPVTPIKVRTCPAAVTTSAPPTCARPASGTVSVVRMRTNVVLPAPFAPSSATTDPAGTTRSTPARAVSSPYRLTRPSTCTSPEVTVPRQTIGRPPDRPQRPRMLTTDNHQHIVAGGSAGGHPGTKWPGCCPPEGCRTAIGGSRPETPAKRACPRREPTSCRTDAPRTESWNCPTSPPIARVGAGAAAPR